MTDEGILMSYKELVADARRFVEQTFAEVGGRKPSKKAMNTAAEKIVRAIYPSVKAATPKRGHRRQ